MSHNPFDDETALFLVLINAEEQHSLWPVFAPVPEGWTIAHGGPDGAPRGDCLAFVEANWTDLRPRSLRDAQAAASRG